jgi:hypothetical protein
MPSIITTNEAEKNDANEKHQEVEERGSSIRSVGSLIRKFSSDGILDAKAAEYIGAIRGIVEDPAQQLQVTVKKLRENIFGFSSSKYTILIVIESGSKSFGDIINDDMSEPILVFKESYPTDQELINVVTVDQYSLDRSPQMASYIIRAITAKVDPATNFTINDIRREEQLVIDTDPNTAKRFLDKHSCKAVTAVDFGFVVSLVNKHKFMQKPYLRGDEFFGVGGYVEFTREDTAPGTPIKFLPIIHITEITSVIPIPNIMALAIPIAAEVFIGAGLWKQPFMNISKKGINIGNLIEEKNGKPWAAKNEVELSEFFMQYIGQPILCLDIVSGHARLPGIGKFASDVHHNDIIDSFAKFLDIPKQSLGSPARVIFREIVGVAEVSADISPNGLLDTRDITYLFAINKLGNTPGVSTLKHRYPKAESRIECIREELSISATPLAMNFCTMLNGQFVQACSAAVKSLGMNTPNIGNNQMIQLNGLNQQYTTGNLFAASPVRGGGRGFAF